MPNQPTLNLSAHQTHVLSALGIDAWYLQAVTTLAVDVDKQSAVDAVIADVAKTLASPVAESKPATIPPVPPTANTQPTLSPISPRGNDANTATNTATNAAINTARTTAVSAAQALPPPITLQRHPQTSAPENTHVDFPSVNEVAKDWQAVEAAIRQLSESNNTPAFSGQGSRTATWLLVAPPPTRRSLASGELLDSSEKTLLSNILKALGQQIDAVYYTPLCKLAHPYDLDPDETTLSAQLPILAAELALVRPEKILLLGQVTAGAVLQSQAILADLMQQPYQLRYTTGEQTQQAELLCLPSLNYFLALPAEKALLWQKIKQWVS